jgi:hypothetical protein
MSCSDGCETIQEIRGKKYLVGQVQIGLQITVFSMAGGTGTSSTVHDVWVGRLKWGWIRDGEASPRCGAGCYIRN